MAAPTIKVLENDSAVAEAVCAFIIDKANAAIKERSVFTIGVSGGSVSKFLCNGLPQLDTDWSKWRVFFCDERHVPPTDPECTYQIYVNNLLSKVPLSKEHIYPIDWNISVEESALDYVKKLRGVFPGSELPRFDVLVLGMGPDGHTCSLFPGHKLLQETSVIAAPISDSPKPPPARVTLTYPVLNNAACAMFVSCGASKADIIKRLGPFQYTPKESAILHCKRQYDQPAFKVETVSREVGKGVFARQDFERGQFLFEYQGEFLTHEAGLKREREYPSILGSYMYFFTFQGDYHCIDATRHECVGKYANDATGHLKNAFPKIIQVEGRPHICLFTCRHVKKGEEIRYDYGVSDLPWRKNTWPKETNLKRPFAHQVDDSEQMSKIKEKKEATVVSSEDHRLEMTVQTPPKAPSDKAAEIDLPQENTAASVTTQKAPSEITAEIDPPGRNTEASVVSSEEQQLQNIVQTQPKALSEKATEIGPQQRNTEASVVSFEEEQLDGIVKTPQKAPSVKEAEIDPPQGYTEEAQLERIVETQPKALSEKATEIGPQQRNTEASVVSFEEEQLDGIVKTPQKAPSVKEAEIDPPQGYTEEAQLERIVETQPKALSEKATEIGPQQRNTEASVVSFEEEQLDGIVKTPQKAPSVKEAEIDPPQGYTEEAQLERIVETPPKALSEKATEIGPQQRNTEASVVSFEEEQLDGIVKTPQKAPSVKEAEIDPPQGYTEEAQLERIVETPPKALSEKATEIGPQQRNTEASVVSFEEEQLDGIVKSPLKAPSKNGHIYEVNTLEDVVIEDSCDSIQSFVYPNYGSALKPLAEVKPVCRVTTLPEETSESIPQEVDHDTDLTDDTNSEENDESEYEPEEESDSEPEENVFLDGTEENETKSKYDEISEHPLDEENFFISQDKEDGTSMKRGVRVSTVRKSKTRIWDKKHCCVFCMKLLSKLPRHYEQIHDQELEVAKFLALPKKSAERTKLIEELRRKGDFAHNTEVLKKSQGSIIPCRRPNGLSKESASNFIPCENCLGFFLAKDLWRHKKNCVHASEKNSENKKDRQSKRGTHQSTSAALLPVPDATKSEMKSQILDTMANDNISLVARTDSLIVQFGTKLFFKTGQEKHQHQYIKQKMREISRFLLAMRKICPSVWSMTDCIDPVRFQNVTEAVKNECGYDSNTGRYNVPSLALKLGHSLKKCAKCLKSMALQSQDPISRTKAEDFHELLCSDWQFEISSQALATLHSNTFNKPKRLPLTEDIRKLNICLQENASTYTEALKCSATESNYQNLSQVTQAQLVLFNRRRGGEIERIPISQYIEGMNMNEPLQEDIAASLSPFEKKLANSLHRIEIRGKRGRKVPVLFTARLKEQVDLLVENRAACGILVQSPFLFSRVGNCKTPYRSCDGLAKFAEQCGAEKPKLLQSTNLRKHIGTVSQILNLRENELDILAGFMGHDIRVHRQFYRLPENTLQLAKVSKILMELESGRIQTHKGKSLDEIEIAEDETLNDDEIKIATGGPSKDLEAFGEPDGEPFDESDEEPSASNHGPKTGKLRKKKTFGRRPWKEEEKEAVHRQLAKFIRIRKVPGKRPCEDAISMEPALKSRPWTQIKFFIKNILSSKSSKPRVLGGEEAEPLPAARVKPTNGELVWFLDAPAASLL